MAAEHLPKAANNLNTDSNVPEYSDISGSDDKKISDISDNENEGNANISDNKKKGNSHTNTKVHFSANVLPHLKYSYPIGKNPVAESRKKKNSKSFVFEDLFDRFIKFTDSGESEYGHFIIHDFLERLVQEQNYSYIDISHSLDKYYLKLKNSVRSVPNGDGKCFTYNELNANLHIDRNEIEFETFNDLCKLQENHPEWKVVNKSRVIVKFQEMKNNVLVSSKFVLLKPSEKLRGVGHCSRSREKCTHFFFNLPLPHLNYQDCSNSKCSRSRTSFTTKMEVTPFLREKIQEKMKQELADKAQEKIKQELADKEKQIFSQTENENNSRDAKIDLLGNTINHLQFDSNRRDFHSKFMEQLTNLPPFSEDAGRKVPYLTVKDFSDAFDESIPFGRELTLGDVARKMKAFVAYNDTKTSKE